MPGGRPKGSTFTQEMGDKILAGIAEGNSLRTVLRAKHMPGMATVFSWSRTEASFRENYEVALATRADAFGEDILAIADNTENDTHTTTYAPTGSNARHLTPSGSVDRASGWTPASGWHRSITPKNMGTW